jgi:hypothetical protein
LCSLLLFSTTVNITMPSFDVTAVTIRCQHSRFQTCRVWAGRKVGSPPRLMVSGVSSPRFELLCLVTFTKTVGHRCGGTPRCPD